LRAALWKQPHRNFLRLQKNFPAAFNVKGCEFFSTAVQSFDYLQFVLKRKPERKFNPGRKAGHS
jgi:hypothetical protein